MNMHYLEIAARLILGLQFFVFGLNGFFSWFPLPEPKPALGKFAQALDETKFILPAIKIIEIICGVLLLVGFWINLATMLLGAIITVVVSVQIGLNRSRGVGISLQLLLPFALLVFCHWPEWQSLLFSNTILTP